MMTLMIIPPDKHFPAVSMISGASGCGAPPTFLERSHKEQEAGHGDTRRRLCLAAGGGAAGRRIPRRTSGTGLEMSPADSSGSLRWL